MSTCDLSVIIISYNTATLTSECIAKLNVSLAKSSLEYEIIVVDNNSTDDSVKKIETLIIQHKNLKLIKNKSNQGFGAANNIGIQKASGTYILLLNSDVVVNSIDWHDLVQYFIDNKSTGALTVDVLLKNGKRDMACHRGFPTIWRSFTYFTKLEKLFGHLPFLNYIFGGYHLLYKDFNSIHEIDSPTGAFFLTRKDILDSVGKFDIDYFMYGEDLDLSYKIKEKGYAIIFYPRFSVLHLKNQSGIKHADSAISLKAKKYFYESMYIFYNKHYASKHSALTNKFISFFIHLKAQTT